MNKYILYVFVLLGAYIQAQNIGVGTNNPNPSAKLDVVSTNGGILIPRVNLVSVNDNTTIPSPATGLMVWNIGFGTDGFYFNSGTSTAPNWVRVLDSTSSMNDADADPSNEFNTNVTLTGNTLNVIDGGGTKSQDLSSLKDHDWYESTGTNQADNIGDNIYTQGNVAIGKTNATQKLDVAGNIKLDDNIMVEGISDARIYRNLVTYNHSSGSSSGVFIINTEMNWNDPCMFTVNIEGYFYDGTAPFETKIGAYMYNTNTFYNYGYTNVGAKNLDVRLARNTNGKVAIILGTDGANYSYPKLSVTSYSQGHSNIDESKADGWSITRAADLTGFTFITNVPDVTRNDADNLGNHTATTTLDMSSNNITNLTNLSTTPTASYDKIRVWNSSSYTIGMNNPMGFGYLNDYAMTFTMNNDNDRGFLWRDIDDSNTDGAMSLTTDGRLTVKSKARFIDLSGSGTRNVVADANGVLEVEGNSFYETGSKNASYASGASTWCTNTASNNGGPTYSRTNSTLTVTNNSGSSKTFRVYAVVAAKADDNTDDFEHWIDDGISGGQYYDRQETKTYPWGGNNQTNNGRWAHLENEYYYTISAGSTITFRHRARMTTGGCGLIKNSGYMVAYPIN